MSNKGGLKIEVPAQGWKQFLTSRKEMLDSYDRARTHSGKHKVQTSHGNVAESEFRKWLSAFLPKKYAVTSGYIISQGISDNEKAPHFDVIIYDHLNSPILWVEHDPDKSVQGKSLAIPAEYVMAVIEVKSAFSKKTVKDAVKHLKELDKLMSGIDASEERYKMYLPNQFFCSTVFFELRKANSRDIDALNVIKEGVDLRGYCGGIILRGEGSDKEVTGELKLTVAKESISPIIPDNKSPLFGLAMTGITEHADKKYYGASISWGEYNFAKYAFDLVALLNSTYDGRLSSFHGFGASEFEKEW
ncbi:MAG: hypothetical protein ACJA1C_001197 [Crocinitomicaceae bacterium]|jgi:hypothetical protein